MRPLVHNAKIVIFLQLNVRMCSLCDLTYPHSAEALRLHGSRLSEYERQEIEKYPDVWFLGLDSCKINAKPGTSVNCGYDDDNGSYNKVQD